MLAGNCEDVMNAIEQRKMSDLRQKVRCMTKCSSDVDFVGWLEAFAERGREILHPQDHAPQTEVQRRDLLRSLSRFQCDQKTIDFAHANKITLGKGVFWWYIGDERTGYIHGLEDESRGHPMITNGIDVWIVKLNGELFKGHRDWLVYDRRPKDAPRKGKSLAKPTSKPTAANLVTAQAILDAGTYEGFAAKFKDTCHEDLPTAVNVELLATYVARYLNAVLEQI